MDPTIAHAELIFISVTCDRLHTGVITGPRTYSRNMSCQLMMTRPTLWVACCAFTLFTQVFAQAPSWCNSKGVVLGNNCPRIDCHGGTTERQSDPVKAVPTFSSADHGLLCRMYVCAPAAVSTRDLLNPLDLPRVGTQQARF